MAAKNTKKKTKAPLKKSGMRRVHGGTDDGASGVGSTSNLPPPTLSGKAVAGGAVGSEVSPFGASGMSRR